MSLIKRRKSIWPVLLEVVMTPFILIFTGFAIAWICRYLVVIGLGMMFFSMWMAGESFAGLTPSPETLYVLLGMLGLIYLAAIPLGIMDYYADGGYETHWQSTPGCLEAARTYAEKLVSGDIKGFYYLLSPELQAELPEEELRELINRRTQASGQFVSLLKNEEIEITTDDLSDPDFHPASDCVLHLVIRHASGKESMMVLYMNSLKSFQIEDFHL